MPALSIFIYLLSVGFAASDSASLVWNAASNSYLFKGGWVPGAVAYGKLVNAINETGWAMFDVTTNGSYSDTMQAYAAGYLEGSLTRDLIRMHWRNTYDGYCSEPYSSYCQRLQDYLVKNFDWMKLQRDQAEGRDPYWHQVGLFLDQLTGIIDGYSAGLEKKHDHLFDVTGLIMLQISGDLEDLSSALGAPPSQQRPLGSGSCSAIVKVLPDNADLYVSHDTWTEYSTMLRILKKYSFNFHVQQGGDELIKGNTVTFSSYPGTLLSGDDFYVISSGLVTQETTIGNSNAQLWAKVKPTDSVLECIRNVVANRLAQTGGDWAEMFSRHNSGTYNNQWMVVDYKLFKPHSALPDSGLLTVVEQIPGLIVSKDQTAFLRQTSYWPSYNVAYYPEVFNLSGGWDNVKKFGDWFTYDKTPRAMIFKRDQSNVVDVASLIKLMRYNDYTKDPYSRCECTPPFSAENSIAARCDLNPANGTYPFSSLGHRDHGATDMKMTNSTLVTLLQFVGISGPTFDPLPPFQWSTSDFRDAVSHVGHPDLWAFKPVIADWDKKIFRSVY